MIFEYEALSKIKGGISISATLLNAFARIISSVYDIGNSLGSSLRRIKDKKICNY